MRFSGKVILVTGSSRGIGRAAAVRFAREGGIVFVHGSRESAALDESYAEVVGLNSESAKIVCDLASSNDIRRMFDTIQETTGRIDVLVNNAATKASAPFLELSEENWDLVHAVNLKAPFVCGQLAARMMKRQGGGSIVNVGSVHETDVKRNESNYSVAKGGLLMLTKNMALELAEHHIRVNQVAPGAVATDMTPLERQRQISTAIPVGRAGSPEEIASLICFLASGDAAYVTGSSFLADGGLTLGFSANRPDL